LFESTLISFNYKVMPLSQIILMGLYSKVSGSGEVFNQVAGKYVSLRTVKETNYSEDELYYLLMNISFCVL
jgi:hypothetical protein